MTTWLEFRAEPMSITPEITEYITGDSWTLTCQAVDCKWTEYGERTPDWMDELGEAANRHQQWHEDGMPQ